MALVLSSGTGSSSTPAKLSKTLWVGDLDQTSTEEYLKQIFAFAGQAVVSVKLIRDKVTFLPSGYGFVELSNHEAAKNILEKFNGKAIPNFPGKRYRLNWASFGIGEKRPGGMPVRGLPVPRKPGLGSGSSASSSSYDGGSSSLYMWTNPHATTPVSLSGGNATLFVGNLHPTTTSEELAAPFMSFGEVRTAKVVEGKGYGFVEFSQRYAAETALHQMHGHFVGPNRVRLAWGHGSEKNNSTSTDTAEDPYGLAAAGYDPTAYAAMMYGGYPYAGFGYPYFGDGSVEGAYGASYEGMVVDSTGEKTSDPSKTTSVSIPASDVKSTTSEIMDEKEEIDFTKPTDLHLRNKKFRRREINGLLLGLLGSEGFRTLKDLQRLCT